MVATPHTVVLLKDYGPIPNFQVRYLNLIFTRRTGECGVAAINLCLVKNVNILTRCTLTFTDNLLYSIGVRSTTINKIQHQLTEHWPHKIYKL
jgi:hypothetical protein